MALRCHLHRSSSVGCAVVAHLDEGTVFYGSAGPRGPVDQKGCEVVKNLIQELMDDFPDVWESTLTDKYKIKIVKDGALASLKYDQIESPMAEPIVQQCRGMVVDTERRKVIAWPYNKFWNMGETLADEIEWSTARVQEKLDGSLMILYWRDAEQGWCVASSGHPTAGGSFGAEARTFREAFWSVFNENKIDVTALNPTTTYMLELCATLNRVVVRHDRPRLVLHGARSLASGVELSSSALDIEVMSAGFELVREFHIDCADDVISEAAALNPIEQEGFVVVDAKSNRVKVKSPRYVILHHMKGDSTPRRAIELWQTGETYELLTHFPEMSEAILPIHEALDLLAQSAVDLFSANYPQPTRKEFALRVKDSPVATVLFKMIDREPSLDTAKSILRNLGISALERMLESV